MVDKLNKWLILPDSHYPYQDKKAHRLIDKIIAANDFYGIAIMGDWWDFYAISSHSKDPLRKMDLADEIEQGNNRLKEFDKMGFKRKLFISGNHEYRLDRYIADKAQEVYRALAPSGLLTVKTIPQVLEFRERGWEWTPYKEYAKIGKLYLTHDAGKAGQSAHIDAQAAFEANVVIGHTHRAATIIKGSARGDIHMGVMLGWLGDVNQVDYMHKIRAQRDWSLGFGIAYHNVSNDFVYLNSVPIIKYTALVEGKLIKL